MNILQVKKYYRLVKVKLKNNLILLLLVQEKPLKNKTKQRNNKSQGKNQTKALDKHGKKLVKSNSEKDSLGLLK